MPAGRCAACGQDAANSGGRRSRSFVTWLATVSAIVTMVLTVLLVILTAALLLLAIHAPSGLEVQCAPKVGLCGGSVTIEESAPPVVVPTGRPSPSMPSMPQRAHVSR